MKFSISKYKGKESFLTNKVIWLCWLQGWDNAPWLVRKCLASWQIHNPDWDVRVLDAISLQRYIELPDLDGKKIIAASLSDIIRIKLLYEYGGVWADATLLCHRPLDSWLHDVMDEGFFAFARPGINRILASWFIAAEEGNPLIERWHTAVLQFWGERKHADEYFWFHYLFEDLCESEQQFGDHWSRVPKISADGPHYFQNLGLMNECEIFSDSFAPVSKLTYRFDRARLTEKSLLSRLLSSIPEPNLPAPSDDQNHLNDIKQFISLKVSTQNLGDHIQIIASMRLIERSFASPFIFIDRDNEIRSCPGLNLTDGPYPIVINGWFKTNRSEWPPNQALDPIFIGFHIRLFQCPELVSSEALEYYRKYAPIGCRDVYTLNLLRSHGIECFHSNCLSLSFPRRISLPKQQNEVFIVSRDERILSIIPTSFSNSKFICHYVSEKDFDINLQVAQKLLNTYQTQAKLIVTTLLHCALPAIAMGIPVVVFYPENTDSGHASDCERFSSLAALVPIYRFNDAMRVNWNPKPVKIATDKMQLVDAFYSLTKRWNIPLRNRMPHLSPSDPLSPSQKSPTKPEAWKADKLIRWIKQHFNKQ